MIFLSPLLQDSGAYEGEWPRPDAGRRTDGSEGEECGDGGGESRGIVARMSAQCTSRVKMDSKEG